jgi:hypothetical protein
MRPRGIHHRQEISDPGRDSNNLFDALELTGADPGGTASGVRCRRVRRNRAIIVEPISRRRTGARTYKARPSGQTEESLRLHMPTRTVTSTFRRRAYLLRPPRVGRRGSVHQFAQQYYCLLLAPWRLPFEVDAFRPFEGSSPCFSRSSAGVACVLRIHIGWGGHRREGFQRFAPVSIFIASRLADSRFYRRFAAPIAPVNSPTASPPYRSPARRPAP